MFQIKRFISVLLSMLALLTFIDVNAVDSMGYSIIADGEAKAFLTDDNIYTYGKVKELNVTSQSGLHGLYIKYDRMPTSFSITIDGVLFKNQETDYLHHFIQLNSAKNVTISFEKETSVADVFAFETTDIPSWVQRWESLEKADIMICPTHSDDDQLYFAGMLPWCAANGYYVQIVYFTNHWNTHDRPHELLDGLWHNGIKYYPVISELPDLYSTSLDGARAVFGSAGYTDKFFVDFYIRLFERYKPLVVACHDINGEYGHGAHMLNTSSVMRALVEAADSNVWNVPKTYIHLWNENKVVFDWDEPLASFDGKSAFTISQESFEFHISQHRFEGLYRWINGTEYSPITKATEIRTYSPCDFGLYRSTVGMDTKTNGLFENLSTYSASDNELKQVEAAICFAGTDIRSSLLVKYKPMVYLPHIHPADDESRDVTDDVIVDKGNEHSFKYFIAAAFVLIACILFIIIQRKFKWKLKTRN